MRSRAGVLRLERARKRSHRLRVRPLEQDALPALDLEQVTEVSGVELELLLDATRFARAKRERPEASGQPLDDREKLERAERLAQKSVGPRGLAVLLRSAIGAREQSDGDVARPRVGLDPPAELERNCLRRRGNS